jgi:hypothetical protein
MSKTNSDSDQYNESVFPFYGRFSINIFNTFARALANLTQFNTELHNILSEAYPIYVITISEYNKSWKDFAELDKILRNKFRKLFDEKFREERFVNKLSDTIASYSELAKITGVGHISIYPTDWQYGTLTF